MPWHLAHLDYGRLLWRPAGVCAAWAARAPRHPTSTAFGATLTINAMRFMANWTGYGFGGNQSDYKGLRQRKLEVASGETFAPSLAFLNNDIN